MSTSRFSVAFLAIILFFGALNVRAADDAVDDELQRAVQDEIINKITDMLNTAVDDIIASQPDEKKAGDAALIVGVFHHLGMLGGPNPRKAEHYMLIAKEKGVLEANVSLADLYLGYSGGDESESGIKSDPDKAMAYLEEAAKAGNPDSMRLLGVIYDNGLEDLIEPDPEKARKYFLDAAKYGDPEALRRLAPVFEEEAERRKSNPDEKSGLPASEEEIVDEELAKKSRERNDEINSMLDYIDSELERRVVNVVKDESGLGEPEQTGEKDDDDGEDDSKG